MKRTLTIVAAVVSFTVFLMFPLSDMNAAQRKGVKTHVSVLPGIPLKMSAASVRVADGRSISDLAITVDNETDGDINGLRLAAFIVRPSGHVKSGEGWRMDVSIPGRSSKTFSPVLRGYALFGERAVIVLQGATGQAGIWETSLTDVFDAATRGAAYVKTAAVAQGTFCKDALKHANEVCRAGLDSFSCDEKNQSFHFTCKNAPVQPEPSANPLRRRPRTRSDSRVSLFSGDSQ